MTGLELGQEAKFNVLSIDTPYAFSMYLTLEWNSDNNAMELSESDTSK